MRKTNSFKTIAVMLVALLLTVTFLPLTVFATSSNTVTTATPAVTTTGSATTTATTTTATTTTAATTTAAGSGSGNSEGNKLGTGFWISMGVLGVLVIVGVVFAIIKRDKVGKWLQSYKSELKKIVWMSWSDVRKNTIVVIVMVVALALLIFLLDTVFFKGITALGALI